MEVTQHFLCDAANAMPDGRLNVLGAFVRINQLQYPASISNITLALRIKLPETDRGTTHTLAIFVLDQDGRSVSPQQPFQPLNINVPADFPPGDQEINVMAATGLIVIPAAGDYRVDASIDGRIVVTQPFRAVQVQLPPGYARPT